MKTAEEAGPRWDNMYGRSMETMTSKQRRRHVKKTNASKAPVRKIERKKVQLRKARQLLRMLGGR